LEELDTAHAIMQRKLHLKIMAIVSGKLFAGRARIDSDLMQNVAFLLRD
jgi:hypothetical protein